MPNEVFLRTRAGLSTMVSSRAADRILEGALKGNGHNPEDVNQSQMRSALLGPVLHELESVLPRHGLKRNLERLAKSLKSVANGEKESARALLTGSIPTRASPREEVEERPKAVEEGSASVEIQEPSAPAEDPAASESFSGTAPQSTEEGPPRRSSEGPFDAFPGPPEPVSGPPERGRSAESARLTPRLLRTLEDEELEEKAKNFALIEHVRLVAAVRSDGTVPVVRGEGLDLELLSRLSRLTLSLLAKGGKLRSLHLSHSLGQLFLFPIGPDLLFVYGGADLNLGSVTTAFTALALEEEL